MQRKALQAISRLIWMTTIRFSYICAAVICMEHTPCSGRATPRPHLPTPIRLDARQLRQTQSKKEFELGLSGELRTGPGIASAYRKTGRPLQGHPV